MKKLLKQKNKAFTLVETLVAISIFTVSLLGIMSVLGGSISNANYVKQKMMASYLAQEGVEYMRNKRDTFVLSDAGGSQAGWNSFVSAPLSNVTPPPPSDSNFTRTFSKTTVSADEVKISSTVSWAQGSGVYNITFSESLFNWIE